MNDFEFHPVTVGRWGHLAAFFCERPFRRRKAIACRTQNHDVGIKASPRIVPARQKKDPRFFRVHLY
jgi:hypothetical protein